MWVSPTHTCLFIGMLMPAMRAITCSPNNSCSDLACSALTLLLARVGADHVHDAPAAHDLAVLTDLLDGWTYLPSLSLRCCGRPAGWPSSSNPDTGATSHAPAAAPRSPSPPRPRSAVRCHRSGTA